MEIDLVMEHNPYECLAIQIDITRVSAIPFHTLVHLIHCYILHFDPSTNIKSS